MADPFSIVAGTIGVVDVTSRLIQYMIATGAAAANVNDELRTLLQEFETLSSVATSIQDLCTNGALQPPATMGDDPPTLKELRRRTGTILIDCKRTLETLEKLVKEVLDNSRNETSVANISQEGAIKEHNSSKPSSEDSKFVKRIEDFRVQLRKQRKDGQFTQLRARLNTSQSTLQLTLQAINQWRNERSNSKIEYSLDRILNKFQLLDPHQPREPVLEHTNRYFEAPAAKNMFIGREALLEQISTAFAVAEHSWTPSVPNSPFDARASSPRLEHKSRKPPAITARFQQRFVIYGLSGSGKTEFCLKFCEKNQRYFWGVFWINASSDEKAQHCFNHIARCGGGDPNLKAAKSWLSSLEHPWLLLIDNADDPSIPINDYIPGGERGHILITTRNPELKSLGTVGDRFVHFEGLEEHEAKILLLQTAEVSSPWPSSAMDLAATITKALGYLPLALVHAGTAIARGWFTLAGYVKSWNDNWSFQRLQWQRLGKNADEFDPEKNVFASYDMMYQQLDKQSSPEARDAIEILKLFAFLDCENIRFDFLSKAARNPGSENTGTGSSMKRKQFRR